MENDDKIKGKKLYKEFIRSSNLKDSVEGNKFYGNKSIPDLMLFRDYLKEEVFVECKSPIFKDFQNLLLKELEGVIFGKKAEEKSEKLGLKSRYDFNNESPSIAIKKKSQKNKRYCPDCGLKTPINQIKKFGGVCKSCSERKQFRIKNKVA